MTRREPPRISVVDVGAPPLPLRPIAMEDLRVWEAKQTVEREVKCGRQEDRDG